MTIYSARDISIKHVTCLSSTWRIYEAPLTSSHIHSYIYIHVHIHMSYMRSHSYVLYEICIHDDFKYHACSTWHMTFCESTWHMHVRCIEHDTCACHIHKCVQASKKVHVVFRHENVTIYMLSMWYMHETRDMWLTMNACNICTWQIHMNAYLIGYTWMWMHMWHVNEYECIRRTIHMNGNAYARHVIHMNSKPYARDTCSRHVTMFQVRHMCTPHTHTRLSMHEARDINAMHQSSTSNRHLVSINAARHIDT